MYIQQLGEILVVPPPRHNTVGVCNQISFLALYCNSSRLVPLLEVINAPIQIPDIVDLTVSLKFLDFSFQICLVFVPEMSACITSLVNSIKKPGQMVDSVLFCMLILPKLNRVCHLSRLL